MHGCIGKWLARTLATAVVIGVPAVGLADDTQPAQGADNGYLALSGEQSAPPAQFVSSSSADVDLAARVAKLEEALKKAEDKAAADKKKAAGKPSVNAGGMLQMDMAGFQQNDTSKGQSGDINNGAEFRRARLMVFGEAFDVVEYKVEFDFATPTNAAPTAPGTNSYSDQPSFKDVYIAIKELPVAGTYKVGHFKEPFGLDQLTSDRFSTYMERSLGDEGAIVPGRNMGMQIGNTYDDDHGTWAMGWFVSREGDTPPLWQNDNGGTAMTMRYTYLPWYDEATEGRGLWHVGAAYSYRDTPDGIISASARPECHLANAVIGSSSWNLGAIDQQLFGAETAVVYGPFSAQAEYFGSWVDRTGAHQDVNFNGAYVSFSYFLTGEHRPYNRKSGAFDRVKPNENFFRVRAEDGCCYTGKGAWEIAYRYSYLDLMDTLTTTEKAGRCSDNTIGLNWYLNPYTRVMADYVFSNVDRVDSHGTLVTGGYIQTAMMRFAIDF
jgi:phosphate-selective porin OprO/OprP